MFRSPWILSSLATGDLLFLYETQSLCRDIHYRFTLCQGKKLNKPGFPWRFQQSNGEMETRARVHVGFLNY